MEVEKMNRIKIDIQEIKARTSIKFNFVLKILLIFFIFETIYYTLIELSCVIIIKTSPSLFIIGILTNILYFSLFLSLIYINNSYFKTIEQLPLKTNIDIDELENKILINLINRNISSLGVILGIIWYVLAIPTNFSDHYYALIGIFSVVFTTIIHFTFRLLLLIILLNVIIHALTFPHKIRRFIYIDIYHGDQCGGLQPIGSFNLRIAYIYFIYASFLIFSTTSIFLFDIFLLLLETFIFIVVGLIFFIIPQISTSFLIKNYKKEFRKANPLHFSDEEIDLNFENIGYLVQMFYDFSLIGHVISLRNFPISMKIFIKLLIIACLPLIVILLNYLQIF
jgi:hypothetical protein